MTVRLALQPPQRKKRSFWVTTDPLKENSDEEMRKRYRLADRGWVFLPIC